MTATMTAPYLPDRGKPSIYANDRSPSNKPHGKMWAAIRIDSTCDK